MIRPSSKKELAEEKLDKELKQLRYENKILKESLIRLRKTLGRLREAKKVYDEELG